MAADIHTLPLSPLARKNLVRELEDVKRKAAEKYTRVKNLMMNDEVLNLDIHRSPIVAAGTIFRMAELLRLTGEEYKKIHELRTKLDDYARPVGRKKI